MAWSHDLGGWAATCATPVIAEGKVYVSSWSQDGEDLWIFDAVTGVPEGRYPLPSVPGDYTFMTMANGVLYATTGLYWQPVIYALDAADGSLLWNAPIQDASTVPVVPANGRLYVNSETYGLIVYGPEEPPAALSISPLSQGDDWDNFLGYTYDATLVGTGDDPWRADGNVITTSLTISNTSTITATNVAITLTVPISLAVTPAGSATQHLGDLGPGQAMTVTWSITATTDSPPSDFTWPAVITAAADNAPPVSAQDEIQVRKTWDSGYRLYRDGYGVENQVGDPLDAVAFDKTYYLEDAATRFHYYTSPWYGRVYDWWIGADPRNPGAGLCSGFSASDGALFMELEDITDWSTATVPYNMIEPEVLHIAQVYQGRGLTERVVNHVLDQYANIVSGDFDNAWAYEWIKFSVKNGLRAQPPVVIFGPRLGAPMEQVIERAGRAHAVLPYKTVETSSPVVRAYVYNPNMPYDRDHPEISEQQVIEIDLFTKSFVYFDQGHPTEYTTDNGATLLLTSVNDYYLGGKFPWATYNLLGLWIESGPHSRAGTHLLAAPLAYPSTDTVSPAYLSIVDPEGRVTGDVDGYMDIQIPNSGPLQMPGAQYYAVSRGVDYVAKITGHGSGAYDFETLDATSYFRIEDASVTPTSLDTVSISQDGSSYVFSTNDASKSYSAVLVRSTDDLSVTRAFSVTNTSLAAGESVTFTSSADLATFRYVNSGGAKTYDLGLEQTEPVSGSFSYAGIHIGSNETHIIIVEDWNQLGTTAITLAIDRGNDGAIDEVVILQGAPTPTPTPTDDAPNSMAEVAETSPNNEKIERYINPSGDEDWFRFELTGESNINVQLTSLPADYDLYLYDANGALLAASERRGVREERIIRKNQPAGFYYVQVVGYQGAWNAEKSYLLRFKVN